MAGSDMMNSKFNDEEKMTEPKTALGDVFQDIIDSNIKHFVMLVNKKVMTKADARTKLRGVFGKDIELPPELLDDEPKLPPNAEFIV